MSVSELTACQKTVERMLSKGRSLAEVEEYVERCALDEMEKAGLWMLAWAHQDQATQLRLANEMLALVSSTRSPTFDDTVALIARQNRTVSTDYDHVP